MRRGKQTIIHLPKYRRPWFPVCLEWAVRILASYFVIRLAQETGTIKG